MSYVLTALISFVLGGTLGFIVQNLLTTTKECDIVLEGCKYDKY